jgi:hypothetical protein
MATLAAPLVGPGAASAAWQRQLTALGVAATALLLLFWRDVGDMILIWWNSSTYNHCLFIPFIIGWLVWQRQADLSRIVPQAWLPALALVGVGRSAGCSVMRAASRSHAMPVWS